MSALDFILIIPIAWFAFKGFSNGLIKELASLVALILGCWIAVKFSSFFETYFESAGKFAGIVSFVVTFFGVLIGISFIGKLTEKIVTLVIPNILNKIAGCLFGALKIAFIFSTLFYYIGHFDTKGYLKQSHFVQNSIFYQPVAKIAPILLPTITNTCQTNTDKPTENQPAK